MKSVCKFELKQDYEDYVNDVDMLGHVIEEDKVYLRLGRHFEFCIHADFTVNNKKNVQVLGSRCDLTKFAKVKITNTDTQELKVINPTKLVNLDPGNYKIDYGVWIDDNKETYTTPPYTFRDCPEVIYIQVDPIVTLVSNCFADQCVNLTGIMFGEPDQYPEGQCVFSEPYSHNDVILNSHIEFTAGTKSDGFLMQCPKIKNIYVADNISTFNGCFGLHDSPMGRQGHGTDILGVRNYSDIKTEIYLGKDVEDVQFRAQNKIYKCIISQENPHIVYDPITHTVIKKELNSAGKKVILTGLGWGYPNNTITIPSGYTMGHGYTTFVELLSVKTIDLSDYDDTTRLAPYPYPNDDPRKGVWYYISGICFDGFRDMSGVETLILPKNIKLIPGKYCNGFRGVKNLIVPVDEAPIVVWSGEYGYWGNRRDVMPTHYTSLTGGTNISSCGLGVNVSETKNLYVIYNGGTSQEELTKKASWTDDYDIVKTNEWSVDTGQVDGQGLKIYTWERPNIWKYIQKSFDDTDIPETYKLFWEDACKSPCREYTINYLSEQQMTNLINSLNPNNN